MGKPGRKSLINDTAWSRINPRWPPARIAQVLGVQVSAVRYYAERHGVTLQHVRRGRPPSIDWPAVDWAIKSNSILAAKLGVTRQCVHKMRKRFDPNCRGTK